MHGKFKGAASAVYILYTALLQTAASALTTVQYLDIAVTVVLCSVAQVPEPNATTTPRLIGGKTLDCVLEFLYSLTCGDRLIKANKTGKPLFTFT